MIGPGTGVAPFIAFMQEREMLRKHNPDMKLADSYLFFGCRKSTSDFIYRDDIAKYEGDGTINEVYIAFSRDNPNTKIYVQDLMQQKKELIVQIVMEQKGHIYMCGNTRMGFDVQNLLKTFIGEEGLQALEKEKRFIKELWGG